MKKKYNTRDHSVKEHAHMNKKSLSIKATVNHQPTNMAIQIQQSTIMNWNIHS